MSEARNPNLIWRTLRRFARFWLRRPLSLTGAYLAALAATGLAVAAPWPLKLVIDNVLAHQPTGAAVFDALPAEAQIALMALGAALLAAGAATASAIEKVASARLRERMTQDLREASLEHVLGLSVLDRHTERSGELVLRLVDDTGQVARLFCKTLPTIFRYLITVAMALVGMFWLSGYLGAVGLAVAILLAFVMRAAADGLQHASHGKRKQEGKVAGFAQEILRGLGFVQAVSGEDEIRQRFLHVNADATGAGVYETQTQVALEQRMQIASGVAVAALIGAGAFMVLAGHLTVGALTVCLAYLNQLLKPVEKINELAGSVTGALTRADRLGELLERPSGLDAAAGAVAPHQVRGEIVLRDCSFAHRSSGGHDVTALHGADVRIRAGECVVIEGPSGAGKSTLLGLLLRLYDPDAGQLELSGCAYRNWPLAALRRQFGVMRQETHLFAGTLRDTLQFGVGVCTEDELRAALARVAMVNFVDGLAAGLDAPVGEDGGNLSGGQRARLALARALLTKRPVLLLDEPFANIDADSRAVILGALAQERGARTIVIVTHQALPAGFADRVLRLDRGRLSECQTPTPALEVAP